VPAPDRPEIRDISVVRFAGGRWSEPASLHDDGWELSGCPVNGPAIAASGQSVAVAWFTDQGRTPRVLAAFSADGGRTFSAPVRLNADVTLGRVAVVMPSADRAFVSFLERVEPTGGQLVVREVRRDGRVGPAAVVGPMSRERTSGFARMAISQGRLVVAWTEAHPPAPTRVRAAAAVLQK
jgi:ribosomal protein L34